MGMGVRGRGLVRLTPCFLELIEEVGDNSLAKSARLLHDVITLVLPFLLTLVEVFHDLSSLCRSITI